MSSILIALVGTEDDFYNDQNEYSEDEYLTDDENAAPAHSLADFIPNGDVDVVEPVALVRSTTEENQEVVATRDALDKTELHQLFQVLKPKFVDVNAPPPITPLLRTKEHAEVVWTTIFSFSTWRDFLCCAKVCHDWQHICSHSPVWRKRMLENGHDIHNPPRFHFTHADWRRLYATACRFENPMTLKEMNMFQRDMRRKRLSQYWHSRAVKLQRFRTRRFYPPPGATQSKKSAFVRYDKGDGTSSEFLLGLSDSSVCVWDARWRPEWSTYTPITYEGCKFMVSPDQTDLKSSLDLPWANPIFSYSANTLRAVVVIPRSCLLALAGSSDVRCYSLVLGPNDQYKPVLLRSYNCQSVNDIGVYHTKEHTWLVVMTATGGLYRADIRDKEAEMECILAPQYKHHGYAPTHDRATLPSPAIPWFCADWKEESFGELASPHLCILKDHTLQSVDIESKTVSPKFRNSLVCDKDASLSAPVFAVVYHTALITGHHDEENIRILARDLRSGAVAEVHCQPRHLLLSNVQHTISFDSVVRIQKGLLIVPTRRDTILKHVVVFDADKIASSLRSLISGQSGNVEEKATAVRVETFSENNWAMDTEGCYRLRAWERIPNMGNCIFRQHHITADCTLPIDLIHADRYKLLIGQVGEYPHALSWNTADGVSTLSLNLDSVSCATPSVAFESNGEYFARLFYETNSKCVGVELCEWFRQGRMDQERWEADLECVTFSKRDHRSGVYHEGVYCPPSAKEAKAIREAAQHFHQRQERIRMAARER